MEFNRSYEYWKNFITYDNDGRINVNCLKYIRDKVMAIDYKYCHYWIDQLGENTATYKNSDDILFDYDEHFDLFGMKMSFMYIIYMMYDLEAIIAHLEASYTSDDLRLEQFFKMIVKPTISLYMIFKYTVSLNRLTSILYNSTSKYNFGKVREAIGYDNNDHWITNIINSNYIFGSSIWRVWANPNNKNIRAYSWYEAIRHIRFDANWFTHLQHICRLDIFSYDLSKEYVQLLEMNDKTPNKRVALVFGSVWNLENKVSKEDFSEIMELYNSTSYESKDSNLSKSYKTDIQLLMNILIYVAELYYDYNIELQHSTNTLVDEIDEDVTLKNNIILSLKYIKTLLK